MLEGPEVPAEAQIIGMAEAFEQTMHERKTLMAELSDDPPDEVPAEPSDGAPAGTAPAARRSCPISRSGCLIMASGTS